MRRLGLALCALLALALCAPAGAAARVPRSFFGVMADGPLLGGGAVDLGSELRLMRSSGAGSVRLAVYWSDVEPQQGTLDLSPLDAFVRAATRAHLEVLPVVLRAPAWALSNPSDPASPPRDPAAYGRFLAALVARYGPHGSFWAANRSLPRRPVRSWQVWNEPDITKYWSVSGAWAPGYVRLLRAARAALRRADPHARVVLAGLTNRSWIDLREVYAAGGGRLFDVAAAHPFSRRVANVVKIVGLVRREMSAHGDAGKPLLLTELSWSSGAGHSTFNYGWETSERGQAARVRSALAALAARRVRDRIAGIYWYTWLSPAIGDADSFDYGGLRRLDGSGRPVSKPALAAFRTEARRLER
jgi:hypothetical protein